MPASAAKKPVRTRKPAAPKVRVPTLKAVHDAVVSAGGLRREVQAAIASQAYPYLVDMLDGFAIQLRPAGEYDERRLRVYFRDGDIEAVLSDTGVVGNTLIDDAVVARVSARTWEEADVFMRRHGVAMQASVDGKPAVIGGEGGALTVSQADLIQGPAAVRARISFTSRRSWLVTAVLSPSGTRIEALDWVLVQHRLKLAGITVEPKTVA